MKRILASLAIIGLAASAAWACLPHYEEQPATYTPTVWPYSAPPLGAAPLRAEAHEPADIASNFDKAAWIVAPYNAKEHLREFKFRTLCNFSHANYDDPIVHPGKKGAAHHHTFLGNTLTDAFSTYDSLRLSGGGTCGGGPLNRSAYWLPSLIKTDALGAGKDAMIKPDYAIVYYEADGLTAHALTRLFRGLTMVFGFNPQDPLDTKIKAEIAAANALPGPNGARTFKSYEYQGNGFSGWRCEASNGSNANSPKPGSVTQPWLVNPDGTVTLNCPTTERIYANIESPPCWDGVNLTSPDGRAHLRQKIRERNSVRFVCPAGWYEVARLKLSVYWSHTGPEDYGKWYLSSDRMKMPDGSMMNFNAGQSFHADWFGAWDYETFVKWQRNCNGVIIDGVPGKGHSCIDTQFGDGTAGKVQKHIVLNSYATRSDAERFSPLQ